MMKNVPRFDQQEPNITIILVAANPASDVESPYLKIHALSELLY